MPLEYPDERKLLVMVNPASGPGKAESIFREKVAPLLAEGNIKYELLITTESGSGYEFIKSTENLVDKYDGIVIVSGDGLVYELMNGLMQRNDWRESIKIPVGVVPGGSGNGLAHSINYAVG